MRVVSINEKAAVSSQSHHRKREARQNLNSRAPASPAQQGGGAGLPGRQGGPGGQVDAAQHRPLAQGPSLKVGSSLLPIPVM